MKYKISVDDYYNCDDFVEIIEADDEFSAIVKHTRIDKAIDSRVEYKNRVEIFENRDVEVLKEILGYVGVFIKVELINIDPQHVVTMLSEFASWNDPESAHSCADGLIMDFLESLGYSEIVESFNKLNKYYG